MADLPEGRKKVVIGDSVVELVSGCQRYQLFQCLLVFIPVLFVSMSNTNFVFSAAATKYRCIVPQCETGNISSFPPNWWPPSVKDYKCTRPTYRDNSTCSPEDVLSTETCNDWVYEDNNSIFSEFGLACQELKRTMVGTIHNLGVLVGMPMIGYVNDRWGRKTAVILNSVSLSVGALKTLTTNYNQYVVAEFFEAALVTGAYTSCYILLVELIGTDKRILASALLGIAICFGEMILALITFTVPYWRHFQLIIAGPGVIFLIYTLFLEESMRWLLTNGKSNKAERLLEKIGNWNQFTVPEKAVEKNLETEKDGGTKEEFHVKLLFQYPAILKRLITCAWWWFSVSLVYYGLIFSSVDLPGNKYTNFALSGFISIVGEFIPLLLLNRIGRKKTFIGSCSIAGVCNVALAYIPPEYSVLKLVMFLTGKMSMTCCFNILYVYTSELMPTSARGFLMGTCSMFARIGTVLAPLALLLGQKYEALPSLVFGCATLLTAALACSTPETLHRQLPDTIAEAIALA